ncbi:mechanosensitive ion channel family protein [Cellulomonas sp. zg-ZUI199]|uniref:Mechanosensitive ion channel family protein n=1 Tax=Cellulomonas wangleii TaxID=2816956 RepID=A0ABX8D810_9CELL|nr:mechanosensitive ion channel family protein [Cellulomonas wangleii]MBO0925000.1 mechanosensitive ion channel family protein [Cellulomonas wangleii]QVI63579.1 mechanosensitive ion channel family protein [Cellulomonas wangleii]
MRTPTVSAGASPSASPTATAPAATAEVTPPSFTKPAGDSWPTWLGDWWEWFVGVPLRIVLIVVISALVLLLLRRTISGVTRHVAEGDPVIERGVLRPIGRSEVGSVLLKANPLATARRAQRARTIGSVLRSTASIVVGSIAGLLVLDALHINLAPFIASAGIVGVAVGFGAQSLVKDFLSGLFMLLEDQYGVGDVVDIGPATGTVENVGLRVTKVRDDSGTLWYVPNGSIVRVGNKTQGFSTALVEVDVDYFVDLDEARGLLTEAARRVATDPVVGAYLQGEPEVTGAEKLAADAVGLRLSVRTAPAMQWEVARHLRLAVRQALEAAGVPLAGQRDALVAHQERLGLIPTSADDGAGGSGGTTPGGAAGTPQGDAQQGDVEQGDAQQGDVEQQGDASPRDPHDTPVHDVVERREPPPPPAG